MSTELSNNLITDFDAMVKHAYQGKGFKLASAVRTKSSKSKEIKFPVYGKLIANEHIVGSKVDFQNAAQASVSCVIKNWIVSSPTDIFEQSQVNYDDIKEASDAQAMAMGRRSDQLVINAMNDATLTKVVAAGGTDLTVDKIKESGEKLDDDEIPMEDRYIVAHTNGKKTLLSSVETTSVDYGNVKNLINGSVDTFYGFKFIWIGTRDEGGLSIDGSNIRTNFAFHKSAIGYGQSLDVSSRKDYSTLYASDIAQSKFAANAVVIDAKGVVELLTDES